MKVKGEGRPVLGGQLLMWQHKDIGGHECQSNYWVGKESG